MSSSLKNKCEITITGNRGYLKGDYPVEYIRNLTSYTVPNAVFTKLFKRGRWDGKKHLFDKKQRSLPAGLVPLVTESLKERGYLVSVVDYREEEIPSIGNKGIEVGGKLKGKFGKGVYDYQYEAAKALVEGKRGILKLATSAGKTSIAAAVIHHLAVPTIFVVPGTALLYQSVEVLSDLLEIPEGSIGVVGDSNFSIGEWITVGTMETLYSKIQNEELSGEQLSRWKCLFADEVHMGGADSFYEVLDSLPAYYRCGLSATPYNRSDGGTLRLIAQTGPLLYEVPTKTLVERDIVVEPQVRLLRVEDPKLPKTIPWAQVNQKGVIENKNLNKLIANEAAEYIKNKKHCIIMVDKLAQGESILNLIERKGQKVELMCGKLSTKERKRILDDFKNDRLYGIVSTSVLNQGVDMDCIDVLILAGGGKAVIPVIQKIGRGLRKGRGRDKLTVVDVMNFTHPYLIKHSQKRLNVYKGQGCYRIYTDADTSAESR